MHQPRFTAFVEKVVGLFFSNHFGVQALNAVIGHSVKVDTGLHRHAVGVFPSQEGRMATVAGTHRDFIVLLDVGFHLIIGMNPVSNYLKYDHKKHVVALLG